MVAADLDLHKSRMATDCANIVTNIRGDGLGLYGRPNNLRNQSDDGEFQFGVGIVHEDHHQTSTFILWRGVVCLNQ